MQLSGIFAETVFKHVVESKWEYLNHSRGFSLLFIWPESKYGPPFFWTTKLKQRQNLG